ncbi:MAG: hypothetical protein B6D63_02825 [Candidatus Latescibacteria bacterium 4484_7]|nr:MAG: hypothetical protein B6D63_02825 [Candidatus Latescibacteria bacterium 4484_7]
MSDNKKIDWKNKSLKSLSVKRRVQLVMVGVGLVLAFLLYSFVSFLSQAGVFKPHHKQVEAKSQSPVGMSEIEYKESLIASIENKLQEVTDTMGSFSDNMKKQMERSFKQQEGYIKEEFRKQSIKTEAALSRTEAKLQAVERKVEALETRLDATEKKIMGRVDRRLKKFGGGAVNNELLPPPPFGTKPSGASEEEVLLPPPLISIDEEEAPKSKVKPEKAEADGMLPPPPETKKKSGYEFSVTVNENIEEDIARERNETAMILAANEVEEEISVDMAVSFTKAYMITGAYAPVFGTSELGSVPVIIEAEDNLLIPNEYTANVDKCFLIGGAIGDPSNDKILIKISKLQCVMQDRTKQIVGKVNGWVYDKYGTPGVHGTFISKTGRYIWRMVVSGILEGLGQGFVNYTASLGDNSGGYNTIVSGGAAGGGQGIQNAFSRLSDFYLKMAEKTLPALEAKGGQKVTVVFQGGEKLRVEDFSPIDIPFLEDYMSAEDYE